MGCLVPVINEDAAILYAAQDDFTIFKALIVPEYEHAIHHELIDRYLMDCYDFLFTKGKKGYNRYGISLPPRSGKTYTSSVLFPAWVLGKLPNTEILLASYSKDLSIENSRMILDIIKSDRYREIFPHVELSPQSKSKEKWNLKYPYRGGVNAVSKDGSVTGKGANLFIIDDLFKDAKEAASPANRENAWKWFASAAMSRLDPRNGCMLVIGTRWNQDDVLGRLREQEGDNYKWITVPAVAEHEDDPLGRAIGDIIWPEKFTKAFFEEMERVNGPYEFSCVYQQNPVARTGNWFRENWFKPIASAPRDGFRVRYVDKAISMSRNAAWTALVLICRTTDGRYIVEDVKRARLGVHEREELIKKTAIEDYKRYGENYKVGIEMEPGSGGKESAEATARNLAGIPLFLDKPTTSKDARLEPFADQAQAGNVWIVEADWNKMFKDEMLAVPHGQYRDMADATAAGFNWLAKRSIQRVARVGFDGLYGSSTRRSYR